jgi:hypothetical protein
LQQHFFVPLTPNKNLPRIFKNAKKIIFCFYEVVKKKYIYLLVIGRKKKIRGQNKCYRIIVYFSKKKFKLIDFMAEELIFSTRLALHFVDDYSI